MNADAKKAVLRMIPYGIYVLTADDGQGNIAAATVNWDVLGGSNQRTWSVSVQASESTFAGCSTIPVSAVTVACTTATVNGGGGTGSCNGSFNLSTVANQVAGGTEGDGKRAYFLQLSFFLAESWQYIASPSCTLTLIYTVNAP